MKTKKNFKWIACALLGTLCAVSAGVAIGLSSPKTAQAEMQATDLFETDSVKYKTARTVTTQGYSDTRRGLLLYAYEQGARIDLKGSYNGIFTADMKAFTQDALADLRTYSLCFTDVESGKSFSVGVRDGNGATNVYVEVDGQKAGRFYIAKRNERGEIAEYKTHGYTAISNNENMYTQFFDGLSAELMFNPETMQVLVRFDDGTYIIVWDFVKEMNDGKRLTHSLPSFGDYTVALTFDELRAGGKGELLLYSVNEVNFDSAVLDTSPINLSASFEANAILNEAYAIPAPKAFDYKKGALPAEQVKVTVYDQDGAQALSHTAYSEGLTFTPMAEGAYYFLYETEGATAYYRVECLSRESVSSVFTYEQEFSDLAIGQNTAVYLPKGVCSTSISIKGELPASVRIEKDGALVEEFSEGGVEYTFRQLGDYEIIYTAKLAGETLRRQPIAVSVDSELIGISVEDIEAEYNRNDVFNAPQATLYQNEREKEAVSTVIFPSGKTETGSEVTLSELGNYTLQYSDENGELVHVAEFSVKDPIIDLFTVNNASVSYSEYAYNQTMEGALLTFKGDGSVSYGQTIDISDNTKYDLLFELIAQLGAVDIGTLYVTLTDIYDPSNELSLRFPYMSAWGGTPLRIAGPGQSYTGLSNGAVHNSDAHNDGGFVTPFNLKFTTSAYDVYSTYDIQTRTLQIYYDAEENAVYANPAWSSTSVGSSDWLVADLDDPAHFERPWSGFTTGEVTMSFRAEGVKSKTGLLLMSVDGVVFNGENQEDNRPPLIEIEKFAETSLPKAKVGVAYKLPSVVATDSVSAVVGTSAKVYFGEEEIAVAEGAFVPDRIGVYTVVYEAYDAFGNIAMKSAAVTATSTLDTPKIVLEGDLATKAGYGQVVKLPAYTLLSAVGGCKMFVTVFDGDGEEVEVKNDSFVCEKEGRYRIAYQAVDYIGQESETVGFVLNVTLSDAPIFDESEIVLPPAFIAGQAYVFDNYVASYYASVGAEKQSVKATIEVEENGAVKEITDGKYVPSEGIEQVDVRFRFVSERGETTVTKTVPVKTVVLDKGFMAEYFLVENATAETKLTSLVLTSNEGAEQMQASFIRPVSAREFSIQMESNAEASFYEGVKLLLRDLRDPAIQAEISVFKQGDGLLFSVNGGKKVVMDGSFSNKDKKAFGLLFDYVTFEFSDLSGAPLAAIETTLLGEKFEGFTSGEIYVEIQVIGITAVSEFSITWLNNQRINSNKTDSVAPQLFINGTFSGRYVIGTQLTLPTAVAYDVLAGVISTTVTVTAPDGSFVFDQEKTTEELLLKCTQYGTYTVRYEATDGNGKLQALDLTVIIYDHVAPTLTWHKALPERVKVGSTLKLPKYTVEDNMDAAAVSVRIYLTDSTGTARAVDNGEISFAGEGIYYLNYYVQDGDGNVSVYTYRIVAG